MNFQDQNVIITGGNGYIGRAIALAFAQAGATVLILGRNQTKGVASLKLLHDAGYKGHFYAVDLGKAQEVEAFYKEFQQRYMTLDVLVNCAGAGESRGGSVLAWVEGQTREQVEQRWSDLAASNMQSVYLMSTLGVGMMPDHSAIINITSTASVHGSYGLYSAFKAGAEGLTRSLAVEFAPRGIRVNALSPGWIQTPNTLPKPDDPAKQAWLAHTSLLGRMGKPAEIASVTLFLASPLASFITGETLRVDGGLTVIDPTAASWRSGIL